MSILNYGSNKSTILSIIDNQDKLYRQNFSTIASEKFFQNIENFSTIVFLNTTYKLWHRSEMILTFDSNRKILMQYPYDHNFYDFILTKNEKNIEILKGTHKDHNFFREVIEVKQINNSKKYKPIKTENFEDRFYFHKIKENEKSIAYENSDKIYVILNLPNYSDNRMMLAKISSFDLKNNKIDSIFIDKIIFYSSNKGIIKHSFKEEINLTHYLNYSQFKIHDPNFDVSKNELIKEISQKIDIKKNLNIKKADKPVITNFYSGSISCKLEKGNTLEVSTPLQKLFLKTSKNYNRILMNIKNNSNKKWEINNLKDKNPIVLKSYFMNSKNNEIKEGLNFLSHNFEIPKKSNHFYNINYDQIIKIRDKAFKNKDYDQIIITFAHEGKKLFDSDRNFKPCKINLKH